MLLLDIESLREGMTVAAPVRHPVRPETQLLLPGAVLEAVTIRHLRRLGVLRLWVRWPSLDFLDAQMQSRAQELREDVFRALKRDFEACQTRIVSAGQYERYRELVARLILELATAGREGLGAPVAALMGHGQNLFGHCANVALLALTLGLRIEDYIVRQRGVGADRGRDLTNLGLGAMLHDVGKLTLQEPCTQHEPLRGPPAPAYQQHPVAGYRMFRGRLPATARTVVLHHHQRFDGTGFPAIGSRHRQRDASPLAGQRIHIFARIVAVCDLFEHLCHDGRRRPRPAVAALHTLLQPDLLRRVDPLVLRALLLHVPPFVLGSELTLSDGTRGAVVGLNRLDPCRPVVRPLDQATAADADIDLSVRRDLHVAASLGVDVTPWLFDLPPAVTQPERWQEHVAQCLRQEPA